MYITMVAGIFSVRFLMGLKLMLYRKCPPTVAIIRHFSIITTADESFPVNIFLP